MNKPYLETRAWFGVYEYRTEPDGAWKVCKDAAGNIMYVPKTPKIA